MNAESKDKTQKKTKSNLVDEKVDVKVKIAALWTSIMFLYIYNDFFTLFKTGVLEDMLEGIMGLFPATQTALLSASILMAIPAVMIFLSLVLRPKANRILNIVLGVLYVAVMVYSVIGEWSYYIFMGTIEIVLTALIVWLAIKWPRSK